MLSQCFHVRQDHLGICAFEGRDLGLVFVMEANCLDSVLLS